MTDDEPKPNYLSAVAPQAAKSAAITISVEEVVEQPTLFALPDAVTPASASIASSQRPQRRKRAASDQATDGPALVAKQSADTQQAHSGAGVHAATIAFIDPFSIEPEPFNGRGLAPFDPDANQDLIEDMRVRGNTVPVRLRPNRDGTGWTCASGSRRVNAGRAIAADRPGFRISAIIDEGMSDADAYALCLADNHGRSDVTPIQRGREMKWAIAHLHDGDRKAYIRQHGVNASVVSRALDLIDLPEQILVCAQNRETLPTVFAEKLSPRLKDQTERKVILTRAKTLGNEQLPASRLLAYLLSGDRQAPPPDRRTIGFGSGRDRVRATVTLGTNGAAVFKIPPVARLCPTERAELSLFLKAQIDELVVDT